MAKPRSQLVNLALVALALGLVVAVVVTSGKVTTSEQDARSFNLLPSYREDDVSRITLEKDGTKLVLERASSGDAGDTTWNLKEPVQEEADAYAVDKLLGSLEFARVVRRIKPEEVNRNAFGLDAPSWKMRIDMGSIHYTLSLGKNAASPPEARYLELAAENAPTSGVVIIGPDLVKELDIDSGALRGRQMLPYTSSVLERIVITGSDGSTKKLKSLPNDRWRFDGMQSDVRVNRDAFGAVLLQFARTKADHFLEIEQGKAALGTSQLVRLELFPKDGSKPKAVIEVGGKCPKSENDVVAVRREPDPVAACVAKSVLPGLDTPTDDLVDRTLFSLHKDEVESLSIERGDAKLALDRKESGFVMRAPVKGDVELDAGNARLEAIVSAVGQIMPNPKLDALGLVPPSGKVTLKSSADSDEKVEEEVLELGKRDKDGRLVVRRVVDGTVLELDAGTARALEADSILVRSRKIFDFSAADFRELEVKGKALHQKLHREPSGALVLDVPKGADEDSGLCSAMVDELGALTAERWVAEHDDGSFGLADPELSLKLSFSAGDAGVKNHELVIGAITTGGAFAKLAGEPGVFVMPRRAFDAVSTLALDRGPFIVTPDVATRVELERNGKKLVLEKQGDRLVRSEGVEVTPGRVSEMADTLLALRAEAAVHLGPAKPSEGFGSPELSVVVARSDKPQHFRIGAGDSWRGTSVYYARAEGVDATFVIAKSKVRVLLDAF